MTRNSKTKASHPWLGERICRPAAPLSDAIEPIDTKDADISDVQTTLKRETLICMKIYHENKQDITVRKKDRVVSQFMPKLTMYQTGGEFVRPDGTGRWLFDLWDANVHVLVEAGVDAANIHVADVGTESDHFFSDRAVRPCGRFAAIARLLP